MLFRSPGLQADIVAILLYGVGYGLIFPAAAGAIAIASAPTERGRANGVFNLSFDLGISAGPILGGLLATLTAGTVAPVSPFVGGLLLVIVAAALLPALGRSRA